MITVFLLSLVASEEVLAATVACGKACLPGPGWGFIVGMVGGFLGIFCLITCCCMTCDNEEKNQEAETNLMTSTGTAEETGLSGKEKLLPSEKMIVQLVDEQMDDVPFPPAELILTTFTKLLSDLTAYVEAPDVQGLLVWNTEPGDLTQVFDMDRVPRGSVKVRLVTYGSVSAGREKWPFNVLFFLKVEPPCDQT